MSSSSYTQRRLHAQMSGGQRGVASAHPAAHSFRVGWGPGGIIAFGSRSVRVAHLPTLDSVCAGSEKQLAAARVGGALRVFQAAQETEKGEAENRERMMTDESKQPQGDIAATAALSAVTQHKRWSSTCAADAAGCEVAVQNSHSDAHVWKGVSTLFAPLSFQSVVESPLAVDGTLFTPAQEVAANLSSSCDSPPPLLLARRREAVLAWLRLVLWDAAAARLEELDDMGDSTSMSIAKRRKGVWALTTTLQQESAVTKALGKDADNAYLASLLAQPAECVRDDLRKQIEVDSVGGDGFLQEERLSLFTQVLVQLLKLFGGDPPEAGVKDRSFWMELPNPWGPQGEWLWQYTLALAFEPQQSTRLSLPCPTEFVHDSVPPCDPIFHLLLLYTGAQQPLRTLTPRVSELRGANGKHWVRFADYSLSWHLQHTVSKLLELPESPCAAALRLGYMHQLELLGCWKEMQYINNVSNLDMADLLCRFPPPDEPDDAILDLLELERADSVATITSEAERLLMDYTDAEMRDELLVSIHVAQATRSRQQHREISEIRQWLHALRIARTRLYQRRSLCVQLWQQAHSAVLLQLPAELLRTGRTMNGSGNQSRGVIAALRFLHDAQFGERGVGEQAAWSEGGKLYHDYLIQLDLWRGYLQAMATGEADAGTALAALDSIEESAKVLRSSITSREAQLRRQLLADERIIGCWTAHRALEVAALAEMTRQVTLLPTLLRRHREISTLDASSVQPAVLPLIANVLPLNSRAGLYRQHFDVTLT